MLRQQGENIVLGLSATIKPLTLGTDALLDLAVMIVSGILMLLVSLFGKKMTKWQGAIFSLSYIAYLGYIIFRNYAAV